MDTKLWDTSNRAVNLILNNLKGTFFPDDNIGHMVFAIFGGWSQHPKTVIYIGDLAMQSDIIMRKLLLAQDENMVR